MRRIASILTVLAAVLLVVVNVQGTANASNYDSAAAAKWALDHVQDSQPGFPGCTWFASQSLWAGGMPQDDYWNSSNVLGGLKNGNWGTRTATLAQDLYDHLRYGGSTLVIPLAGRDAQYDRFAAGRSAIPEARSGDLIAYDWDNDGVIDHMSVVTSISTGDYPNVSEWGTAGGAGSRVGYRSRGWTWSVNENDWLRVHNPKVVA